MDPRGWTGEAVYDPFKVDDFFMRPRPYKQPGEAINMGNPRNLYKKLLLDANQISSSFPLDKSDKSVDCSAEFEAAKNLFQKNWRLHSASWTDYEKKKVKAAHAMIQIVEIVSQMEGKKKKEKILNMDLDKFGDLIMDFIEDEACLNVSDILGVCLFKIFFDSKCWTIAKFLLCAMEENFISARNSELSKEYENCRVNKQMHYKDQKLGHELLIITFKLHVLKKIFGESIDHLDFGIENYMSSFDEEAGQFLMGKFKDRKLHDPEFAAVPARIENYEVAEKTAKLISKLSNKRIEYTEKYPESLKAANDWQRLSGINSICVHAPILLKMKEFFAGFVYYAAGKFHPSEAMKYKMIKKALTYWVALENSDFSSIPEIYAELGPKTMIPKLDECYAILWKLKYNEFKENPSEAAERLLTQLAECRVKFGKANHSDIGDFEEITILYDMIKCYQVVLKQHENAKKTAEELIGLLLEDRDSAEWFFRISKVRVNKQFNKKILISKIIESCK